jgi:hypothetical protein
MVQGPGNRWTFCTAADVENNPLKFVNHACYPNAKLETWKSAQGGQVVKVVATESIPQSTEVCVRYSSELLDPSDPFCSIQCKCGSPQCFGTIGVPMCTGTGVQYTLVHERVPDDIVLIVGRFTKLSTGVWEKSSGKIIPQLDQLCDMDAFSHDKRALSHARHKLVAFACHVSDEKQDKQQVYQKDAGKLYM